VIALDQAIYGRLNPDTTLQALGVAVGNVHKARVPEDQPLPAIVYTQPPGQDDHVLTRIAYTTYLYTVKAITAGYGSEKLCGDIAARIHALLNDATFTVVGYTLMNCRRMTDISYPEQVGSNVFFHAGGTYEMMVT